MWEGLGRESADDRESLSIDSTAVQADDALIDALAGSDPKAADELGYAELNALLLDWSRDVDAEPVPELVDYDMAFTTIKTAALANRYRQRGNKRKLLVPVAAAATVLGIAFSGASVAVLDAQPGDTLWSLTKVVFAEKADSVQASFDVRAEFKAAQDALEHGDLDKARYALTIAEERLQKVGAEEDREALEWQHQRLMDRLEADPPQPTKQQPASENPARPTSSPQSSDSPRSSDSPQSSNSPEVAPEPAEVTTPPESSKPDEPPPTTTSDSNTTSNDAPLNGSTSQPGADSASVEGEGVQSSSEPVG